MNSQWKVLNVRKQQSHTHDSLKHTAEKKKKKEFRWINLKISIC